MDPRRQKTEARKSCFDAAPLFVVVFSFFFFFTPVVLFATLSTSISGLLALPEAAFMDPLFSLFLLDFSSFCPRQNIALLNLYLIFSRGGASQAEEAARLPGLSAKVDGHDSISL